MRVRLRYSKLGKVRFTSHRDVARIWERALRRSGLPVASSEGFSPRPRLHFGLALSTAHESLGEYIDVDLHRPVAYEEVSGLAERLTPLLPPGMEVQVAAEVDRRGVSLQQDVVSCTWRLDVPGDGPEQLAEGAAAVLGASTLPVTRERKGQVVHDDIRPGILRLDVLDHPGGARVVAELATRPRGIRPGELMSAFSPARPDPVEVGGRVCRTHQWIERDGARREPLGLTSGATPPGSATVAHPSRKDVDHDRPGAERSPGGTGGRVRV